MTPWRCWGVVGPPLRWCGPRASLGPPWGTSESFTFGLYLDVTGEGQKAARELARQAVLRGLSVHTMDAGAYGGHPEPSAQWEAEGRVTLEGTELELCREFKAPVYFYATDGAPYCEVHGLSVEPSGESESGG